MPRTKRSASRSTARAPRPGPRWRRWTCCHPRSPTWIPSAGCAPRTRSSSTAPSPTSGFPSGSTRSVSRPRPGCGRWPCTSRSSRDAVLHAAPLRQGPPRGRAAPAAGAGRRPAVGALRHPARRHRAHAAPGPRRVRHGLAQRPRRRPRARPLRASTSTSTTSSSSCRCSGPARTSWPCASRACPVLGGRGGAGRGPQRRPAREHHAHGRAGGHAGQPHPGEHAGPPRAARSGSATRSITTVPLRYAGAGRRVYPGFLQLAAFVAMNPSATSSAHLELFGDLVDGDELRAARTSDVLRRVLRGARPALPSSTWRRST